MAEQYDLLARAGFLNSLITRAGSGALLRVYDDSAGKPLTCAAPRLGVRLLQFTCATPFAPATSTATLLPTIPANVIALATGTALYYSVMLNDGTTCFWQGDVVATGNGLVLNPSNNGIVLGMPQGIDSWSVVVGGA